MMNLRDKFDIQAKNCKKYLPVLDMSCSSRAKRPEYTIDVIKTDSTIAVLTATQHGHWCNT